MTSQELILLTVNLSIISAIGVIALAIALVIIYHIHKKELENIMKYEINIGATIDDQIPKMLEQYVTDIFTDYRLRELEPKELLYINPDQEIQILDDVANICKERLSPAMVDKLSLFWNKEQIGTVIADKLYMVVVHYVSTHNAVKNDEENLIDNQ